MVQDRNSVQDFVFGFNYSSINKLYQMKTKIFYMYIRNCTSSQISCK